MAYGYYATVTVDNTKVDDTDGADLTNFPVLISGTYDSTDGEPDLRTTANGGKIQNTDASGGSDGATTVPADLVFSPNTDGSSPYDFEIESYNAATGAIIAWVEIPTLDYNDDTVFYMVYGDSGVTTSQEDVNGTWGAYNGVWHLKNSYDGTAGEVKDSTGNNNGKGGAGAVPVQVAGVVGNGQDFQANADYIDVGDPTTWDGATSLTMEFWYNPDTINVLDSIVRKASGAQAAFYVGHDGTNADELAGYVYDGSNLLDVETTNADLATAGGWYHVTWTWDATADQINCYLNGSLPSILVNTGNSPTAVAAVAENLTFGARYNGGSVDSHIDGQMDEIRMSSTYLTPSWAYTNYNTQNSPSTFYTMGNETAAGAGGAPENTEYRGVLTTNTKFWQG